MWPHQGRVEGVLVSAAAGNKSATRPPPPAGVQRRMERNRQKPVGRDKGSLTAQQTKGTATTTIHKKGDYTEQTRRTEPLSRTAPPLCPPELRVSSPCPAPPQRNPARGTWYGIPGSVWPGWGWVSPPGPFLDSGEN